MDDHFVVALKRLCDNEGGYKPVAQAIGANDQTIYQIVSGVKLPSGKARGVGRQLRERLERAYPGWANEAGGPAKGLEVQAPSSSAAESWNASHLVGLLADSLDELTGEDQERVAAALLTLARAPDSVRAREALLTILRPHIRPQPQPTFSADALDLAKQLDAIPAGVARDRAHAAASMALSLHELKLTPSPATSHPPQPPASSPVAHPRRSR